ncbi:hypothetical protein, partial [Micromonospora sp. C41]|uniref:hypothetical protein n=1 Tax=Micromonospora sp. C41 TaxID=2824878 RepID=UPI001B36CE90
VPGGGGRVAPVGWWGPTGARPAGSERRAPGGARAVLGRTGDGRRSRGVARVADRPVTRSRGAA